jgi:hypothetical protein
LLVIAAIIYFVFIRQIGGEPSPTAPVATSTGQLPEETEDVVVPSDKPRNYQQYDISKEVAHTVNADDIAKLASSFAERLGSFSNQSNYSNFDDLSIFMTASMRTWADSYVLKTRAENPYNGSYYGITTKAVGTEIKSFDEEKAVAEIIVGTQRREVKIDGGENNFTQNLRLSFVKQNGRWLVDGAYWEK